MNTHKLVGVWFGSSKRQAFQVLRMVKHSLKVSERKVLYWFKRKKAKLIELLFNVDPRSGWSLFKLGNNWGSTQVQSSKGSRSVFYFLSFLSGSFILDNQVPKGFSFLSYF